MQKTSEDESLVLCSLNKINGAFGFYLRDNAGHFLGTIEEGGSADVAGVKDNDEIVEVNGVNVEKVSHDEVRFLKVLFCLVTYYILSTNNI